MDPADPAKGFRYLYLTPEDYTSIAERAPAGTPAVRAESIAERGEQRWRLTGEHAGCPERGVFGLQELACHDALCTNEAHYTTQGTLCCMHLPPTQPVTRTYTHTTHPPCLPLQTWLAWRTAWAWSA